MNTVESKKVIMASLDDMDKHQTEKVLDYIQTLLMSPGENNSYQKFKESAIKQIKKALREG